MSTLRTPFVVAAGIGALFGACVHFKSADAPGKTAAVAPSVAVPVEDEEELHAQPTSETVGSLDNTSALSRFFRALAKLDDKSAATDVRVVQFGDSHTAADLGTGTARKMLQTRFGDGGRGFIALGRPWKTYMQDGLKSPGMKDFTQERGKIEKGRFAGDGCYGVAGVCIVSTTAARAWTEIVAPASRIEVEYMQQPQGGTLELWVDDKQTGKVVTRGTAQASGFAKFDVNEAPHKVEVRAMGDGDVRFYGVSLDRPRVGVIFDALGINGARATTMMQWNEAHMADQLQHRTPELVILAYGTNEAFDEIPVETFERQLVDALGRVARAVPQAACMLLGPPDMAVQSNTGWMTPARLQDIVDAERKVARAAGCAFFDQLAATGGPGTMATWAEATPPKAQKDHVHYTRDGYVALGTAFATDLLRAYAAWRSDMGLPAIDTPPPATTPPPDTTPTTTAPSASPFVAIPM